MKSIGILLDNYKLDFFKTKLAEEELTDYHVTPGKTLTTIKITVRAENFLQAQNKVTKILTLANIHFNQSN